MGEPLIIKSGDRYGNLTVVKELARKRLPSGQINRVFQCKCDCGNIKAIRLVHLSNERTTTCGKCMYSGKREDKEYIRYIRKVWKSMKSRVSPNYVDKHLYFKKGITVCEEWNKSFNSFYKWAKENNLKQGLQIDRIDNSKGYSPENCRAATPAQNVNNRDVTFLIKYNGKLIPFMEIIEAKGLYLHRGAIRTRISRGWDAQIAVDTPIRKGNYVRKHFNIDEAKKVENGQSKI